MELESAQISLVSANAARPARLADEDLLYTAAPPGYPFLPAQGAPVVTTALQGKRDLPMGRAPHDQALRSGSSPLTSDVSVVSRGRTQSVSPQPDSDRGRRSSHLYRDLSDGHAGIDQRLQLLSRETAPPLLSVLPHLGSSPLIPLTNVCSQ